MWIVLYTLWCCVINSHIEVRPCWHTRIIKTGPKIYGPAGIDPIGYCIVLCLSISMIFQGQPASYVGVKSQSVDNHKISGRQAVIE